MIIIMATIALATLSITVIRYGRLEDPVMAWAAGVGGGWARRVMVVLTRYGRLPFWSAVVIAMAGLGRVAAAITVALAMLASIIMGRAVKEAVRRRRPYEGMPLNAVAASGSSFPSNHCSVVWGASLLALSLLGPQLSLPLIAEATLVSTSRVLLLAHYPSDCVGGFLIGVISWRIGLIIYRVILGLPLPL